MQTTSLEAFLADLAFQLDSIYRDVMTDVEVRVVNTLVTQGYGAWTGDGAFKMIAEAPATPTDG